MANFQLRDVDDHTWAAIMTRAQIEGWPLKDLILTLLEDYQAGRVTPSRTPPMPPRKPEPSATWDGPVVVLKFTCPNCNKAMEVECGFQPGFGQMIWWNVECPHCLRPTERALPGPYVDSFKPGERNKPGG